MTDKKSGDPPAAKPPVPLWYDVRFSQPPPFRVVAALTVETKMTVTAYRDAKGNWRVVGRNDPVNVAWWSDCIPTPLPDPARERDRLANESRPSKA